jgi:hypothetical protein
MRPCVWIDTGDTTNTEAIEFLPELLDFTELLLDFDLFDELDDFTELLLDFTFSLEDDDFIELLLDFGTLDELDDFTELLLDFTFSLDDEDFGSLDEDTSVALEELEELETLEELELLGAVTTASRLSINLSETDLFNTGYLSLSDCVQTEPSKP